MKHPTKKLIRDASYSPSLIGTVVERKHQVAKDQKLRQLTLLFVALTIIVNVLMFISPPENSLATSTNDLVAGGLSHDEQRAKEILTQAIHNDQNPGGNQEQELRALYAHYDIDASDIKNAQETNLCLNCTPDLYAVSREQHIGSTANAGVSIGGLTYYEEPLAALYPLSGNERYAKALKINPRLFVLYSSGNIVYRKFIVPELKLATEAIADATAIIEQDGDRASSDNHRITVRNSGEAAAKFAKLKLELPKDLELLSYTPDETASNYYLSDRSSDTQQIIVEWDVIPAGASRYVDIIIKHTKDHCINADVHSLEVGTLKADSCTDKKDQERINSENIDLSVRAINTTTGEEASGSPAQSGDEIEYTLVLHNPTTQAIESYEIPATNISDIAEYANVSVAADKGIVVDDTIQWSIVNIAPGEKITRKFTATIKETVPNTTQSASDSQSFDCTLTTTIGNTITNIGVACGVTKEVEQSVNSLPYLNNILIIGLLSASAALAWLMYTEHKHLFNQLELIHAQHTMRR
jgi:hypothetical protein